MRTVGAYEAKTHLPQLLLEVANGETITITKNGRAVAQIVPPSQEHSERLGALQELLEWRGSHAWQLPPGKTIRDLIEEGRR